MKSEDNFDILYTDRDISPAENVSAEEFLEKIKKPKSAADAVLDYTNKQETVPAKKSNTWIWVLVVIIIVAIIVGLLMYLKLQKEKQNGSTK